jgi:hypothetical protein
MGCAGQRGRSHHSRAAARTRLGTMSPNPSLFCSVRVCLQPRAAHQAPCQEERRCARLSRRTHVSGWQPHRFSSMPATGTGSAWGALGGEVEATIAGLPPGPAWGRCPQTPLCFIEWNCAQSRAQRLKSQWRNWVRCARLSILPKDSRVWVAAPPSGGLEAEPPKTPQRAQAKAAPRRSRFFLFRPI